MFFVLEPSVCYQNGMRKKYTCQYFLDHHLGPESGEAESVKEKLSYAVKTTTGQHTAGLVIVPENRDINEFTPVQFPANDFFCPFCHYAL